MNWTGGRLSRHARKTDGSLVNKQKQHFAKVRNTLLHGANKSPKSFSIFGSITFNVKRGSSEKGDNEPVRYKERPPSRHYHHSERHHSIRKRHQETAEPESHAQSKRRKVGPDAQDDKHGKVKIKKEAFEVSTHRLHKADVTDIDDEVEVLRRKKLKLLRDSDWLGLRLQEPVKLKYAPTGVDDNIGRRRRLKPGHEARYEKQHMRSPPARRNYDARSEVRVAIDGKERRVGVSSSAAPSQGRVRPPMSSQSTEAMLLDVDNGATIEPEFRPVDAPPPGEDLGFPATPSSGQPMLHETAAAALSSSSIRKRAEELGCAVYDDGSGNRFKSLLSSSQHTSSQKLPRLPLPICPIHENGNGEARNKWRLIMPSSPPALHHPVPRKGPSRVLRKNSLDIASSVAATVGEIPKLTEAEVEGDKMWKDWLDEDPARGPEPGPGSDEDEEYRQRSITPGVSQYVPQQSLGKAFESEHERQSSRSSAKSGASAKSSNASMLHNMMRMSSSVNSTSFSAPRTPPVHNQAMSVDQAAAAIASNMQADSPQPEIRQRISLPLPDVRTTQRMDDNAAWKTFLQSPSELRYDAEPLRPFQKPPIRRPAAKDKDKRKTADPDAAWKSFVLTNDSDSEGENSAFNSFWKKNEVKASRTQRMGPPPPRTSSSHASLEVHAPTSMELSELPYSTPRTRTPAKPKSHAPFLSSSQSDYFDNTQVLDDRSIMPTRIKSLPQQEI